MSASLNKVLLIGNLTRDPEMRYTPSGQVVVNFSLAVNRRYSGPNGERKEDTTFVRIVVWGKLGETCNQYLKKGSPVCVEGRLQSRSWDAQDGTKRSAIEVVAQNVQFLPRANGRGDSSFTESTIVSDMDTSFAEPASASVPEIDSDNIGSEDEIPF